MLDLKTLFVMIVLINFTLGVMLRLTADKESGLIDVAYANLAHGTGYLLFLLSPVYGNTLIWLGESCIAISIAGWMGAILQFVRQPTPKWAQIVLVSLVSLFTFIHVDEKESRLIFNSTIYVIVEIYVLYVLRKHWATIHGRGKHLVFLSVIVNMLMLLYRELFVLFKQGHILAFYDSQPPQFFLYTSILMTLILLSVGFLIMSKERADRINQDLILKDGLTGVWNRRKINEVGAYEVSRQQRYGTSASLAVIDIDNFKKINDIHGHATGDLALRAMADACQAVLRETDIIGRWGGEEFVVIFPNTGLTELHHLANALCRAVNNIRQLPNVTLSVSIGISACLSSDTFASWFARADNALYQAKRNGKNRAAFDIPLTFTNNCLQVSWNDQFQTGQADIDAEHAQLIGLINRWIAQSRLNYTKSGVLESINHLRSVMFQHFETEIAALRQQYTHVAISQHQASHDNLLQRLDFLVSRFTHGQLELDALTEFLVCEFFVNHILTDDRQLFATLRV